MQIDTHFPKNDYAHASKTQLAQELADWFIEESIAVPVYSNRQGTERRYYKYIDEHGYWKQVDENIVLSIAKEQIKEQWTRHTKQEFLNQIRFHEDAVFYDEMGLDESEVLMRNCKVINLDTGDKRIVRKKDYALNQINADFEKHTEITEFLQLLRDTLPEESHRKTFQEFVGWCLRYPNGKYEKALLILGETDSGKSTILKIVRKLFENAQTSEISLSQLGHERTFHVHHIAHSILNVDEDMSSANIQESSSLKKIISQENMFVEPKNAEGFKIEPTAKLMIASNVAPNPDVSSDRAFYNRFITLEAPDQVPKEEQDKTLVDRLTTDEMLDGLWHWAIEGLRRLEDQGTFTYSPTVSETRDMWDKYGSNVHKFLSECVEIKQGNNIPTSDVYEYYEMWSIERMGDTMSKQDFISELASHPKVNKERKSVAGGGRRMCFTNIEISVID